MKKTLTLLLVAISMLFVQVNAKEDDSRNRGEATPPETQKPTQDLASILSSTIIFLFTEDGEKPIGTAFIVGFPVPGEPKKGVPLIVTAKHVVSGRDKVLGRFTLKGGGLGIALYDLADLRRKGDLWEHHDKEVDIIVFRTEHFKQADYKTLPISLIASKENYVEDDITATDRVIFPCLLRNFLGTTRNYPIIRDGTIALIPDELVPLKNEFGTEVMQEVILVEAVSFNGASGSPIFLWPGPRLKRGDFLFSNQQPWLLGIMHGFYPAMPRPTIKIPLTRKPQESETKESIMVFQENANIAIIFPSWRLLEILEQDKVKKRIQKVMGGKK
jgi:hypothetical protein